MEDVLWFEQLDRGNLKEAGGKGANLGEMSRHGFPVPPGFVTTSGAYYKHLDYNELQGKMEKILGPLLLVIGLVMLEVIQVNFDRGGSQLNKLKEQLSERGYIGAFLLGVIFAMSFCPFSAVLYFGMLIPLALKTHDGLVVPSIFALATGLPVIISSILLVKGVSKLSSMVNKAQSIEKTVRRLMATLFVAVGIYYILRLIM